MLKFTLSPSCLHSGRLDSLDAAGNVEAESTNFGHLQVPWGCYGRADVDVIVHVSACYIFHFKILLRFVITYVTCDIFIYIYIYVILCVACCSQNHAPPRFQCHFRSPGASHCSVESTAPATWRNCPVGDVHHWDFRRAFYAYVSNDWMTINAINIHKPWTCICHGFLTLELLWWWLLTSNYLAPLLSQMNK